MSKEYSIPGDMKRVANAEAIEMGIKPHSVHHIVPRSLAKKYNLPKNKIVSPENAIALEDDYIYLAVALLGLSESYFDEGNIHQPRANRKRKKKTRGRKGRRH